MEGFGCHGDLVGRLLLQVGHRGRGLVARRRGLVAGKDESVATLENS